MSSNQTTGSDSSIFDTSLFHLFPSGSFSFREIIDFTYSTNIYRPNYTSLANATLYVGGEYYVQGNVKLLPTYNHSLELTALKGLISLRYTLGINPRYGASLASNDSSNYFYDIQFNAKRSDFLLLGSFKKWTFKKGNTSHWIGIMHTNITDLNNESPFGAFPMFRHWTRTEATLSDRFKADVTINYGTIRKFGIQETNAFFMCGVGIYYTTKSKKLKINLNAQNLTNQQFNFKQVFAGSTVTNYGIDDSRMIELAITYKVGRLKAPSYSIESGLEDRSGDQGR